MITLTNVEAGKTLVLGNKESLVMAGEILMNRARKKKVNILPVDSEHSAIFQALQCGKPEEVKKVILTASGGPFYHLTPARLKHVTVRQALNHPTWNMGNKITIDSATLMNKALEIIEAKWLFGLAPEQIEVVIHPQSIIHSMVEFQDGSVIAQIGSPDMKIPIQFALTYPERLARPQHWSKLSFSNNLTLNFLAPDMNKFPALKLGYQVARAGGTSGAVLNAANEESVKLFLQKRIAFTDIADLVKKVVEDHQIIKNPRLNQIFEADAWARTQVILSS
ncbi:1-deoxy-D-xylulose 5-phosphate reductoisomerase [subsurface metagenome]